MSFDIPHESMGIEYTLYGIIKWWEIIIRVIEVKVFIMN